MAGGAAGVPAVVSVVEVIKNAEVDLRLGITADGRIVVVIRELVQCALLMSERGAQRFLSDPANQDLAQTIGMVALDTARWHGAKVDQVTCDVRHVAAVLEWALDSYSGIVVLAQEQRAELVAAVHKAACDLAATRLTRARDANTGSIGVDIAVVDAEVRRLRAHLQSTKEDLQRTHTELAALQAEANRCSLALTAVKHDLEREGRTCKSRSCAGSLKPQLVASQEYNNVAEERAAMLCHNKISRKKQAVAKRTAEK